jgi:hypothetical protein
MENPCFFNKVLLRSPHQHAKKNLLVISRLTFLWKPEPDYMQTMDIASDARCDATPSKPRLPCKDAMMDAH